MALWGSGVRIPSAPPFTPWEVPKSAVIGERDWFESGRLGTASSYQLTMLSLLAPIPLPRSLMPVFGAASPLPSGPNDHTSTSRLISATIGLAGDVTFLFLRRKP